MGLKRSFGICWNNFCNEIYILPSRKLVGLTRCFIFTRLYWYYWTVNLNERIIFKVKQCILDKEEFNQRKNLISFRGKKYSKYLYCHKLEVIFFLYQPVVKIWMFAIPFKLILALSNFAFLTHLNDFCRNLKSEKP